MMASVKVAAIAVTVDAFLILILTLVMQFAFNVILWQLVLLLFNRLCELITLFCFRGTLPCVFTGLQIPFSIFALGLLSHRAYYATIGNESVATGLWIAVGCCGALLIYEIYILRVVREVHRQARVERLERYAAPSFTVTAVEAEMTPSFVPPPMHSIELVYVEQPCGEVVFAQCLTERNQPSSKKAKVVGRKKKGASSSAVSEMISISVL